MSGIPSTPQAASPRELTAADVRRITRGLLGGDVPAEAGERLDLLRALAELVSATAAVQATVALAVDDDARAEQARAGVPVRRRGRDVAVLVGLALRESPARARSFLGAARAWRDEMPHTFAALREGRLTPWRAMVMVRETACLPVEERGRVDAEICGDVGALDGLGTAALTARLRRRAAELDPAAAAARARRAAAERAVWVRPAPDTMTCVTALLPVAQGVGVYAALKAAADAARAQGDERGAGQVMADTFVERVTGQRAADEVPVSVNLVVSDATLLGAGHEPGLVVGGGSGGPVPVPAQVARNLVAAGLDAGAVWLRRVYADPAGRLVGATSRNRFFADGLAEVLRVRDQGLCRTPHCDAPVRHLDHVVPVAAGGRTTESNGQGLCEACNQAKNAGSIRQQVVEQVGGRHAVVTTTVAGHADVSVAPLPPRPAQTGLAASAPRRRRSRPARQGPARQRPPGVLGRGVRRRRWSPVERVLHEHLQRSRPATRPGVTLLPRDLADRPPLDLGPLRASRRRPGPAPSAWPGTSPGRRGRGGPRRPAPPGRARPRPPTA